MLRRLRMDLTDIARVLTWDRVRRGLYVVMAIICVVSVSKAAIALGGHDEAAAEIQERIQTATDDKDAAKERSDAYSALVYSGDESDLASPAGVGAKVSELQNEFLSNRSSTSLLSDDMKTVLSHFSDADKATVSVQWLPLWSSDGRTAAVDGAADVASWRFLSTVNLGQGEVGVVWVCQCAPNKAFDTPTASDVDSSAWDDVIAYATADYDADDDSISNVKVYVMSDWKDTVKQAVTDMGSTNGSK